MRCGGGGPAWAMFPDEVWEQVFSFLGSDADRNAAAAVCRAWARAERRSRRRVFVGNCYAVAPAAAVARFPEARAAAVKGKPHFADFNLVPGDWGGGADAWVAAMAEGWPLLEELRLKRMVVSDDCLEALARAFKNLRVLALTSCDGFSTAGLAAIAAHCRNLRELDLQENMIEENCSHWLSHFPESFTSLVNLNIACLEGEVNVSVLERLVSRCPNLKTLGLNQAFPLDKLNILLRRAPQLIDLGTGRFDAEYYPELFHKLESAFSGCKSLRGLSGIWEAVPAHLPALYSICEGLTSLNLSYATIQSPDLIKLVSQCKNLQKLWVMDFIEDAGLAVVASSCKLLQELRVFPSDPYGEVAQPPVSLTERGLIAVSTGCPMLHSVLYFCRQMTNSALITVAHNRPNLIRFRLCILEPHTPDYLTFQPLDAGFSAIVESCRDLCRLSLSGLLTDRVFKSIGAYADCLEMLSVAFAGDSDAGLHYILSGCKSLKKLEIRDCPFGAKPLLANAAKLETMRSLWMSSCAVTLGACRLLAQKMPQLNVEVIDERGGRPSWELRPNDCPVEKLFVYRTLAGRRADKPPCVWIV
ncbi:Transport inhibitor response 1-like protein [Ananas comosus]|uniref:Transport inhibitor response 1-like protein n=1 Tax=Ananas comosus TaxID=4615 RepID=A0A199V918_ANACO|nr:Transport inhibitor response 1-like protein [Ananas comosus]